MSPKIIDYKKVEELYNPNLSDEKNAIVAGISYLSFWKWRTSKGYANNHDKKLAKKRVNIEEFMRLYDLGYSDVQIADELDSYQSTITGLRHRLDLPMNRNDRGVKRLLTVEKTYDPSESDKPWKDPESLFCSDSSFFEKLKHGEVEL